LGLSVSAKRGLEGLLVDRVGPVWILLLNKFKVCPPATVLSMPWPTLTF